MALAFLFAVAPGLAFASGGNLLDCQAAKGSDSDMVLAVNAQRQLHLTQTKPTSIDINQNAEDLAWSCGWYRLVESWPVSFQLGMDGDTNSPDALTINGRPVNVPLTCVGHSE